MDYKITVGVEVHCELKTKEKIFSPSLSCYGSLANSNANVIDFGYPGVLPQLNKEVLEYAIRACKVLNLNITKDMHFDRKNYFYADNPKNFQITQNETPIGTNGYVEIEVNGEKKKIEILEMHIEEDTCKSVHGDKSSLLDFNRAGVPLIEIVTKPCVHSSEEAVKYLHHPEVLKSAQLNQCYFLERFHAEFIEGIQEEALKRIKHVERLQPFMGDDQWNFHDGIIREMRLDREKDRLTVIVDTYCRTWSDSGDETYLVPFIFTDCVNIEMDLDAGNDYIWTSRIYLLNDFLYVDFESANLKVSSRQLTIGKIITQKN